MSINLKRQKKVNQLFFSKYPMQIYQSKYALQKLQIYELALYRKELNCTAAIEPPVCTLCIALVGVDYFLGEERAAVII